MGNLTSKESFPLIGYEQVKSLKEKGVLLINTLSADNQLTLIGGTVIASQEAEVVNEQLANQGGAGYCIYGKNCYDSSVFSKYRQLKDLNAHPLFIYAGGLFEWLLLNEVYGNSYFPITGAHDPDILVYK